MCDHVSFFNCPLDITCTEGCKTKEMSFISPFVVLLIPSHVNGAEMEASIKS